MKEYISIIKRAKIFDGLTEGEIYSALSCLSAGVRTYKKGTLIYSEGNVVDFVGIILSGEVQTLKTDFEGNTNIVAKLFPMDLVAGVAACSNERRLPFDMYAVSDVELLCMNSANLIRTCCKVCVFHARIIENLLKIVAEKNVQLSVKIDILTKRTTREKVLAFLYRASKKFGTERFSINMSRRQMAEYLSVNRSALSRELCKMQEEGIIEFNNNSFKFIR